MRSSLAVACLLAFFVSLVVANEGGSTVAYGMGCLNDEVKNLRFELPRADWNALETVVTAQAPDLDDYDTTENPIIRFVIQQEENVTHADGSYSMEYVDTDMWFDCEAYSSESFECYHLFDFNDTVLDAGGKIRLNVFLVAQSQLTACVVVDTTALTAVGRYQGQNIFFLFSNIY